MRRGRGRERGRQARQSEEGEEEDEAGMGRKRGDGWNRVQKGALTISLHLIPSSPKQIPHVYTPVSPIHLTPPPPLLPPHNTPIYSTSPLPNTISTPFSVLPIPYIHTSIPYPSIS